MHPNLRAHTLTVLYLIFHWLLILHLYMPIIWLHAGIVNCISNLLSRYIVALVVFITLVYASDPKFIQLRDPKQTSQIKHCPGTEWCVHVTYYRLI